jgi:hypothetical protein
LAATSDRPGYSSSVARKSVMKIGKMVSKKRNLPTTANSFQLLTSYPEMLKKTKFSKF